MSWISGKWNWAKQKPLFWSNLLFLAAIVVVIWVWPRLWKNAKIRVVG